MKALIIDDEVRCRKDLAILLQPHQEDVQVIGFAENVRQGISMIRQFEPNLIFLDIEMPDGNGFDLLRQVKDHKFHVIFTTAHVKYAITAIKFGALDYLLKPIGEDELAQALQKLKEERAFGISKDQYQLLLETLHNLSQEKLPTRLAIPTLEGVHYKFVKDIIRFEASRNYTKILFSGAQKKLLASVNLGEYEQQFELYPEFIRVHKSHMVNLHYLETYVRADGGYLVLQNGDKIGVSRLYREDLVSRLGKL